MGLGRMNYGGSISSCKANPKPAQSLLRNDNEIVNPRLSSFFGQNVICIFKGWASHFLSHPMCLHCPLSKLLIMVLAIFPLIFLCHHVDLFENLIPKVSEAHKLPNGLCMEGPKWASQVQGHQSLADKK